MRVNMVCIVVPIYKEFRSLSNLELVSLHQLYRRLGSFPLFFIGSTNLKSDEYLEHSKTNKVSASFIGFAEWYFASISGYNKLLISLNFYREFVKYKHILLYQLDAYVFRNDLEFWCQAGYDYIGAPWTGLHAYDEKPLIGVGNGGFSLRSTKGAILMLKKLRYYDILENYRYFSSKGIMSRLPGIFYKLRNANKNPGRFESEYGWQEDIFWCIAAPERLSNFSCRSILISFLGKLLMRNEFKIAPIEMAISFSFETNPAELYKVNGQKLPFGCHAWEKYDPNFWKEYIAY